MNRGPQGWLGRTPARVSLGVAHQRLYELDSNPLSGIVDVTEGNNTFTLLGAEGEHLLTIPGYSAKKGYDMASGLGTVNGAQFAHALGGH